MDSLNAYWVLLAALWVASIGFPLPEDIALLTAGYACYEGYAHLELMVPLAMFGVLSGDLFIYYLGRRWAANLFEHRWIRWIASPERLDIVREHFHNHQIKTVCIARFLPGMRAVVFLTAGVVRMSLLKFLLADGLAALGSVPLFLGLGYLFGHSIERKVHEVEHILVIVAILVAGFWLIWHTYSRSAKTREVKRLIKIEDNNGKRTPEKRDA